MRTNCSVGVVGEGETKEQEEAKKSSRGKARGRENRIYCTRAFADAFFTFGLIDT
jgi:hypothetical protein